MNILFNIRKRFNRVVAAVMVAVFLMACGGLLAFVLSPQKALQARHIERLPDMAAQDVAAAAPGDEVLITGRLEDNPSIAEGGFVAYKREKWQVSWPTPSSQSGGQSGEPTGEWKVVEHIFPDLTVDVDGRPVDTLRTDRVTMSGPLHEQLIHAYSFREAKYNGQMLAEGSVRVRGFYDGDLVTVLGIKASAGGVVPEEMYAGDKVAFVRHKRDAARGTFLSGLCLMGMAPIVVVGGILAALIGRR